MLHDSRRSKKYCSPVTADFANYCLPLIQGETKLEKEDGLPRVARLKKVFAK